MSFKCRGRYTIKGHGTEALVNDLNKRLTFDDGPFVDITPMLGPKWEGRTVVGGMRRGPDGKLVETHVSEKVYLHVDTGEWPLVIKNGQAEFRAATQWAPLCDALEILSELYPVYMELAYALEANNWADGLTLRFHRGTTGMVRYNLVLVTFDKNKATNSDEARQYAWRTLTEEGFASQSQTRFGGGWGDWFVIGGHYSGALLCSPEDVGDRAEHWLSALVAKQATMAPVQLVQIANPTLIESITLTGVKEDAQIINQGMYEAFFRQFEGETEVREGDAGIGFVDLDYDDCGSEFIGTKWAVVVDVHEFLRV